MVRHLRLALTGGENKSTLTIRTHGNRIVRINMCALYAHIDIQLYMIVNMHFTSAFAFAYIICVFRCPFKVQSPFYRTWDQSHLPGSFCWVLSVEGGCPVPRCSKWSWFHLTFPMMISLIWGFRMFKLTAQACWWILWGITVQSVFGQASKPLK